MTSAIDHLDIGPRMPAHGKPVRSGPTLEGAYSPPIDFHPGVIEAIDGFKEFQGYLTPAQEAFSSAYEGLKAIRSAYDAAARNPAWNQHQRLLNVAGAAEKQYQRMLGKFDAAIKNLSTAAKALDESLSQPLEQQAGAGTINSEIRAHVKALSSEARMNFINDAIADRNSKVLTAVLGAPSFLSGLKDPIHASFTRLYWEKTSPEAVGRLTATRRAIELLEKRGPTVHRHVERAMGGQWATVQALRKANSEAEKALLMQQDTAA